MLLQCNVIVIRYLCVQTWCAGTVCIMHVQTWYICIYRVW